MKLTSTWCSIPHTTYRGICNDKKTEGFFRILADYNHFLALALCFLGQADAQCTVDSDCGTCEKCVASVCEFQTTSEDTKNECSDVAACLTGYCDGAGACDFEPANTECRASAGICDIAENCTGSGASCPADGFEPATTECRTSTGQCDPAENCTGSSADCPADTKSTAECRASTGVCDIAESCDGINNDCPADQFEPVTTVCRAAAGECDDAEYCNGSTVDCPADDFKTAGMPCTDDGNECTDDECDGAGNCAHPDNTASCDDGDFCNGPDTCSGGSCSVNPGDPCASDPHHPHCNEGNEKCDCWMDGECEDSLWCNGDDFCGVGSGTCYHLDPPCESLPSVCDEVQDLCVIQWAIVYQGSSDNDYATSIQQTFDQYEDPDGYIVVGHTKSFGAGEGDIWVLKLDSNGEINNCDIIGNSDATIFDTSVSVDDLDMGIYPRSTNDSDTSITPQGSSAGELNVCYPDSNDPDGDGIQFDQDNCWYVFNPDQEDNGGSCEGIPTPYFEDPHCGNACECQLCQEYLEQYQICLTKQSAGRELDYEACKGYTDQGSCEGANCTWNDKSPPAGAGKCVLDICLTGVLSGKAYDDKVTTKDYGVLKAEFGRSGCP